MLIENNTLFTLDFSLEDAWSYLQPDFPENNCRIDLAVNEYLTVVDYATGRVLIKIVKNDQALLELENYCFSYKHKLCYINTFGDLKYWLLRVLADTYEQEIKN